MADENTFAARCVSRTAYRIRAENLDARKMRNGCVAELNAGLQVRSRGFISLEQIVDRGGCFFDECDRERLWPGLDRQTDLERSCWSALRAATNVIVVRGFQVEQRDADSIDAHLELLTLRRAAILRSEEHTFEL